MGNPLRRTVEGLMGDLLYQKLGSEPRIDVTWNLLRDLIGQQLFSTEFIPVPFLDSAAYYNQLFVLIKKPNILSTLRIRPPTYKVIGNLDYLLNRDASTWIPQFDFSPWDVADSHSMYKEYRLRITSNQRGEEKFIDFKLMEPRARSAQPPETTTLTIHRNLLEDLAGVRSLYVITDVVLATYLKLMVRIGNHQMVFIERDKPIAFKYQKYKLDAHGTFLSQMNTNLKVYRDEAIWLRPFPQPIPNMPMWDHMRRRLDNANSRKIRHNLTIPQPSGLPDSGRRRPVIFEGLMLREMGVLDRRPVIREREVRFMEDDNRRQQRVNVLRHHTIHHHINPLQQNNRHMRRTVSMETMQGSE